MKRRKVTSGESTIGGPLMTKVQGGRREQKGGKEGAEKLTPVTTPQKEEGIGNNAIGGALSLPILSGDSRSGTEEILWLSGGSSGRSKRGNLEKKRRGREINRIRVPRFHYGKKMRGGGGKQWKALKLKLPLGRPLTIVGQRKCR